MKSYLIAQIFTAVIAALLIFTFYALLATSIITGQSMIAELIMIVNAVILLAIFAMLAKIENSIGRRKK